MSKSSLPEDAAKALRDGNNVFVCRINQGVFQMSGNTALYGIAEVMDKIQRAGWVLDKVSWVEDRRDHPSAFCVFQRAQQQPVMPPPQYAHGTVPQQQWQPQPPAPQGWSQQPQPQGWEPR
ncbi:hypothetical protein [Streptacidiphilus sp. EB103A]|uniref:hypothetical protein n=1 Tax=Streptacidiphilus sp. EB103A TaxID=3156275 RepID=UPI003510D309